MTSGGWRYEPHNLGRWPADVVPYPDWSSDQISQFLAQIGENLAAVLPGLHVALPAERMLERLRHDGEDAWCEQLWIADLESAQRSEE